MAKKRSIPSEKPIPEDFLREMESLLGPDETRELAGALDESPSVSIRINRRKVKDPSVVLAAFGSPEPVEWCGSGFRLGERPDFIHDPLLHAGAYYVQEAASMIYEPIVENIVKGAPGRHWNVLDLCSAPGGKATAMLNGLYGESYTLVANEFDRGRSRILKENLDKWGDPDVILTNSPAGKFVPLGEFFDIVAVDAPCSGEGMMRREQVARTQWSRRLVEQCASLQRNILKDALKVLKPGGFLIYSTCTFNVEENELNVKWLLENSDLEPVGNPRRFMPHRCGCEGLFVAVMRRKEPEREAFSGPLKINGSILRKAGVNVISEGMEQTSDKNGVSVPSSRCVLGADYDPTVFPAVEVDLQDALSYLRGNQLFLPSHIASGYVCISYKGFPLGLVKNIGTRANNLYPREWRVRT